MSLKTLSLLVGLSLSALAFAACERPQPPACKAYEDCLAISCTDCTAVGEESLFAEGGDCWTGTETDARNCEEACYVALETECRETSDALCCATPEKVYIP
jgi:hypothetical protein